MEPAKIDWNRIDSCFIEDSVYEHINAPKWVDFLSLDSHQHSSDDDAWFCTPDCNHPKTAEDFLQTPPLSKFPRSVTGGGSGGFPFRELNQGDGKLKRRGQTRTQTQKQSSFYSHDDGENQNPNLSTPQNHHQAYKSLKAVIKSSSEKKKPLTTDDNSQFQNDEMRGLKSSASTRNLFAGKDILNHISEFCNELKKLAIRARERETEEDTSEARKIQDEEEAELEKVRKPLLEFRKPKRDDVTQKGTGIPKAKEPLKKIRRHGDDAENMTPLSLNLENVKQKDKGSEWLLQIRTNPPSPQCFSAPFKSTTPSKAPRSTLMERGILHEVKQKRDIKTDKPGSGASSSSITNANNVMDERQQARVLDVFWFLKPCTMSE